MVSPDGATMRSSEVGKTFRLFQGFLEYTFCRLRGNEAQMAARPEKCVGGHCDIAVGQVIFQVYEGDYWSTPYISPTNFRFLGNWCIDCFQRDFGHLIPSESQQQPYECTICSRGFVEHERVIYVTTGTRPRTGYRAEKRGNEIHVIVGKECWKTPQFERLYKLHKPY
jgi:hypothetical protein